MRNIYSGCWVGQAGYSAYTTTYQDTAEMAEAIAEDDYGDDEIDCGGWGREDSDIATTDDEEVVVVQLKVGDTFESFEELEKRLKQFDDRNFVKFWKREARTREAAMKRVERHIRPELKYYQLKYACIHKCTLSFKLVHNNWWLLLYIFLYTEHLSKGATLIFPWKPLLMVIGLK